MARRIVVVWVAFGLVAAAGCGGDDPTPDPTPVNAGTGGEDPPAAVPRDVRPTPDLMRRLADGQANFTTYLDMNVGIILLEYYSDASGEDPSAGDDGVVRIAQRLCGAELSAKIQELREDLARRVEAAGDDPLFNCTENECFHDAAQEHDRDGRYSFRDDPDRGLVLDRVTRIEGGPVTDEFLEQAETWAEQEAVRLAAEEGSCESADGGAGADDAAGSGGTDASGDGDG